MSPDHNHVIIPICRPLCNSKQSLLCQNRKREKKTYTDVHAEATCKKYTVHDTSAKPSTAEGIQLNLTQGLKQGTREYSNKIQNVELPTFSFYK